MPCALAGLLTELLLSEHTTEHELAMIANSRDRNLDVIIKHSNVPRKSDQTFFFRLARETAICDNPGVIWTPGQNSYKDPP